MAFFNYIDNFLTRNDVSFTIMGGDWNTTFSTDNSVNNIDIFGMVRPPGINRAVMLNNVCTKFNLTDPYRFKYYNEREFTYVPRNGRNNRSRLDFFLVSENILELINDVKISNVVSTKLFDHKLIKATFFKPATTQAAKKIDMTIFMHPFFDEEMSLIAVETFLQHAGNTPEIDVGNELLKVGALSTALRNLTEIEYTIANLGINNLLNMQKEAAITEVELAKNDLLSPEGCNNINLNCHADTFLEVLLGNLRNAIISLQSSARRVTNARKNRLIKAINALRGDYAQNEAEIFEHEAQLTDLINAELKKG